MSDISKIGIAGKEINDFATMDHHTDVLRKLNIRTTIISSRENTCDSPSYDSIKNA